MSKVILRYGIIAGLIAAIPWMVYMLTADEKGMGAMGSITGMAVGYTIMLVAFSMVFLGIKRYRDTTLGGVIRFGPALLVGLGITVVASVMYMLGWEICVAFSKFDFSAWYANLIVEEARSKGASPAELERATASAAEFARNYSNPLWRMPMTFIEIFPVGLLVSLISAALLRNSRLLPARAPAS